MKVFVVLSLLFFCVTARAEITKDEFDTVMDQVISLYADRPIAEGAVFDVRKQYTYPEAVGSARRDGNHWIVEIWGGFPHSPVITTDSFAVLVCHELGHHLGGPPYFKNTNEPWGSAEGQADYFATNQCMKSFLNTFVMPNLIPEQFPDFMSRALWQSDFLTKRILQASFEFATAVTQLQNATNVHKDPLPHFETPDPTVVSETLTSGDHPNPQCRLDTLVAGYFGSSRPACWYHK